MEKLNIININEYIQHFTNAMLEIANLTIGQSKFAGKKPLVPRWN